MYGWNQRRTVVEHSWYGGTIDYSNIDMMEFSEEGWREYPLLPVGIDTAQAVWLNNTLYVGGGFCTPEGYKREDASLYFFEPGTDTVWSTISTPTRQYGLVVHEWQVLLVGGREYLNRSQTKKIYTLRNEDFHEVLPRMKMEREAPSAVSTGDILVVAGGKSGTSMISSVDFLKDGQWFSADHSLPNSGCLMSSCSEGDLWCLLNGCFAYSVSLSMLVGPNASNHSPWKSHTVKVVDSAVALVNGQLLSIGGDSDGSTAISAFSTASQSWIDVADLPLCLRSCAVVKSPTGELLVIGGLSIDEDLNESSSNIVCCIKSKLLLNTIDDLQIKGLEASTALQQTKDSDCTEPTYTYSTKSAEDELIPGDFVLPGVEVSGRITVEVTNSAQSFSWDDHGFNLHIPQDSLPTGLTHCTLDIMSSTNGHYQPPDDHELLSPVYWVRPTPVCIFKKPLTLEIQHCAKMSSTTELTFVRALCSRKNLPYQFEVVTEKGSFSIDSSFGSLKVCEFSGYGTAGKIRRGRKIEKNYVASFYYHILKPYSVDIYFAITLNHKSCITKMKNLFDELEAKKRLSFSVEFEDDKICLDIPSTGTTIENWKVEPMTSPAEILQRHVDFSGRLSCLDGQYQKLKARLPPDWPTMVPECTHSIALKGAKQPKEARIELDEFIPYSRICSLETALVPVSGAGRSGNLPTMTSYYSPHHTASHYHLHLQGATTHEAASPGTDVMRGSLPEPPAMSIEQLVDHVGISRELLDREVSDQHLRQIASLLPNWQSYAKPLGLTSLEIQDINDKSWADNAAKALELMDKWHQKQAFNAKYINLVELCLSLRHVVEARKICSTLKDLFSDQTERF